MFRCVPLPGTNVGVRRRIMAGALVGLLVVVCGLLGYGSVQPPNHHEFRVTAVRTAQAAHDALRTADLTGGAVRDGNAPGPYAAVLLDGSAKSLGSAVSTFAELSPPDKASVAMRDELLPMLTEAVRRLGDAAADPTHTDGVALLADKLGGFVERHG
jgi:hypothetical protein